MNVCASELFTLHSEVSLLVQPISNGIKRRTFFAFPEHFDSVVVDLLDSNPRRQTFT